MKLFLLLFLFARGFCEEGTIEDEYITASELQLLLDNNEVVMVAFSTTNCPHCQEIGSKMYSIRNMLKANELDVKFYKMDVRDAGNSEFVQKFEVRGVPTIYTFFGNDGSFLYDGDREDIAITNYFKASMIANFTEVSSIQELDKSVSEKPLVAPLFEAQDSDLKHLLRIQDTAKVVSLSPKFLKDLGLKGSLAVFRSVDDYDVLSEEDYKSFDIQALAKWIKAGGAKALLEFPSDSKFMWSLEPTTILFYFTTQTQDLDHEHEKLLISFGSEYRRQVAVARVYTEHNSQICTYFEISETPDIRIYNVEKKLHYRFNASNTIDLESIKSFLDGVSNGTVAPFLKNQELPDDWNTRPVKFLNSKVFDEIVYDKTKHVFVKFYAPWCGHCKQMAGDWEELGKEMADKDDIVIAELDATNNDLDGDVPKLSGFPTIILFKKHTNEAVTFDGSRKLGYFKDWLLEHTAAEKDEL